MQRWSELKDAERSVLRRSALGLPGLAAGAVALWIEPRGAPAVVYSCGAVLYAAVGVIAFRRGFWRYDPWAKPRLAVRLARLSTARRVERYVP